MRDESIGSVLYLYLFSVHYILDTHAWSQIHALSIINGGTVGMINMHGEVKANSFMIRQGDTHF